MIINFLKCLLQVYLHVKKYLSYNIDKPYYCDIFRFGISTSKMTEINCIFTNSIYNYIFEVIGIWFKTYI
jgi:hypothetical protein